MQEQKPAEAACEIDAIILMIGYLRRQVDDLEPRAAALSAVLAEAESCALLYRGRHPPYRDETAPRRADH